MLVHLVLDIACVLEKKNECVIRLYDIWFQYLYASSRLWKKQLNMFVLFAKFYDFEKN